MWEASEFFLGVTYSKNAAIDPGVQILKRRHTWEAFEIFFFWVLPIVEFLKSKNAATC